MAYKKKKEKKQGEGGKKGTKQPRDDHHLPHHHKHANLDHANINRNHHCYGLREPGTYPKFLSYPMYSSDTPNGRSPPYWV